MFTKPLPEAMEALTALDQIVSRRDRRIAELEAALRAVVRDVTDYEAANKLSPNPGRSECWDSVARAKALLQPEKI